MDTITQEDVLQAFRDGKRKRFYLLYLFFKDKYFDKPLSAGWIAGKIAQELDLPITRAQIFEINRRYRKRSSVPSPAVVDSGLKEQLKRELKSEILAEMAVEQLSLEGNRKSGDPQASPSLMVTGMPADISGCTKVSGMTAKELDKWLSGNNPSLKELQQWYDKETDAGKRAIMLIKIKEGQSKEKYNNSVGRKSIFD